MANFQSTETTLKLLDVCKTSLNSHSEGLEDNLMLVEPSTYVCPLCMKTEYTSLSLLCFELTKATIKHIQCPLCAETILGLDKYTIHLYSHLLEKEKHMKTGANSETAGTLSNLKQSVRSPSYERIETGNLDSSNFPKNCINVSGGIVNVSNKKTDYSSQKISLETPKVSPNPNVRDMASVESKNLTDRLAEENNIGMIDLNIDANSMRYTCYTTLRPPDTGWAGGSFNPVPSIDFIGKDLAPGVNSSKKFLLSHPPHPVSKIPENYEGKLTDDARIWSEVSSNHNNVLIVLPGDSFSKSMPKFLEKKPHSSVKNHYSPVVSESGAGKANSKESAVDRHENSSYDFDELIKIKPAETLSNKPYKCGSCSFSFPDDNILKMHQQLVHQSQSSDRCNKKVYVCQFCNKSFKMKGSLLVHYRVAHKNTPNSELFTRIKSTNERETLEENVAKESNFMCNICSKTYKKEQLLSQHLKTHENKQWECDVCFKCFTTKYFLKKHKRLHTGDQRYYCELCNKAFTFQQSYHKHVLYHTDEKPYPCSVCGRAFKELSTLHNHERIHTGEKPYSCETCGKSFRQRVSCLVHSRIHTGIMPYKCTACNKRFRYKGSEKSHKCPVSPPGQIVLCGTNSKGKNILSSLKNKLTVLEKASEIKPKDKTTESEQLEKDGGPDPEAGKNVINADKLDLMHQYFIVVPTAEDAYTDIESNTSLCVSMDENKNEIKESAEVNTIEFNQDELLKIQNSSTNTECLQSSFPAQAITERSSGAECNEAINSDIIVSEPSIKISVLDFFSDPDELFSSLTFSS